MLRLTRKILRQYGQPLLAAVLLICSWHLQADCSSSVGTVTINEYNNLSSNNSLGSTYVEIKTPSPPPADLASWKIYSYTKTGALNGSVNIPSSGTGYCSGSLYRAAPITLNSSGDGYVLLVDAAGKLVDALYVNVTPPSSVTPSGSTASCTLSSLPYDYDITSDSNRKNVSRDPDGTGTWVTSIGSGNNSEQTLCTNNRDLLSLTKTVDASSILVGQSVTFTMTVKNTTQYTTLSNLTVVDTLPAGFTRTGYGTPSGASFNTATNTWTVTSLAPGASATMTLIAQATAIGTLTNSATAYVTSNSQNYQSDAKTAAVDVKMIGISVAASPTSISQNGSTTFTITVSNPAGIAAPAFTVANVLQSGLTGGTAIASIGSYSNGTWSIPAGIAAGGSATLTIAAQGTQLGTFTDSATATLSITANSTTATASASGSVTVTAATAQSFNAWTNTTGKTISTQVAGSGFTLTVGAFDSGNTATSYSGTVAAQLEYCTNVARTSSGGISCGGSWATISGATANATFSNATTATASMPAVANAYEIVRVKLTAGSTISYATDYFAIRPASLTVTASDATSSTAGTTNLLNNSGQVHKAGQYFTLQSTTGNSNYPGTLLSVSGLTPTATLTMTSGLTAGTLATGTWASISGGMQTDTATYTEVGPFDLKLEDQHFADIDAADSTSAQRYFSGTMTVGRFIPDHFDTVVVRVGTVPMDCPTGLTCPTTYNGLAYAGQSFTTTVTARNAGNATTTNYNGTTGYSKATTLAAYTALGGTSTPSGSGAGTLSGTAVAANSFSSGVATLSSVAYAFTTPPGTPTDLYLRAAENTGGDGVSSLRTTPANSVEGGIKVAQGRIRLSNAFGNSQSPLDVPVAAQFWNGQVWAANNKDSSTLTSGAVAAPSGLTLSSLTFSSGRGTLRFAVPASAGSYDIALNLGASSASLQSCVSGLTGGTAAGLAWLRSRNGNCAATYDRDPSARVTFGIYPPESQRTIHVRELF